MALHFPEMWTDMSFHQSGTNIVQISKKSPTQNPTIFSCIILVDCCWPGFLSLTRSWERLYFRAAAAAVWLAWALFAEL